MRISARNKIEGEIISISAGKVGAVVKLKVDEPFIVTSLITREAVDELGLKEGDKATAVVKATEVMISK